MTAFYRAALRERRRLHVLHGRRLQGRRGAAAARALRRIAAVDRPADLARSSTSASASPTAIQRVRVEKGREPRAQTVISFFADPPPTPIEQEYVDRGDDRPRHRAARRAARGARPDLHRRRRAVAAAAAARRRAHPGAVRRGAGERRGDDRPRAAGDQAAAGERAVGRPRPTAPRNRRGATTKRRSARTATGCAG